MSAVDPSALERLLTSREPEALRRDYMVLPGERALLAGTAVPALGMFRNVDGSHFAIPASAELHAPIDYMGVYVTLDDYWPRERPEGVIDLAAVTRALAARHTVGTHLMNLALLNHLSREDELLLEMVEEFRGALAPEALKRFDAVMRGGADGPRRFVARQQILAAMRYVLDNEVGSTDDDTSPPLLFATFLAHAVGSTLVSDEDESPLIAGVPEAIFFDVLRLSLMYQKGDMWSSIDRIVRLWRDYGGRIERFPLRETPAALLCEATGLELEELLALGFAVYAHSTQWRPGGAPFVDLRVGSRMDRSKLDAFVALMSATPEEFADAFSSRAESAFDFLPFQDRPILRHTDGGLLALDAGYLWDRVTTGLYWMVHDHEKGRNERDRQRWTQGFAEAIELMAEDALRAIAPAALGEGTTFYTEEDFERAYGTTKRCDGAIDLGSEMILAEVVSGQLSVPSRIAGERAKYVQDTDRLVISKCRQLHAAADAVLDSAAALTGYSPPAGFRIIPVLLVGGGYPINPLTNSYIADELSNRQLLVQPRVEDLCIIDLGELEMLEGLAEHGPAPVEVLRSWKASSIAAMPLRNFILREYGGDPQRPSRMRPYVEAAFEAIRSILLLRDDPMTPASSDDADEVAS